MECPNCRHLTSLPQEGVSGLQGAFLINHLFDIQDILKKVSTPAGAKCVKCKKRDPNCYCRSCGFLCESCKKPHLEWDEFSAHDLVSLDQLTDDVTNLIPPAQKTLNCSKHPTKELDLYCETCKEVICRDCILKVHRDHRYDLATDVFPQQKKVLVSSVEPVEQQLASVNKALEELQALSGKITSQSQALETQIKAEIRLAHQALEAREQVLISQLDQITREKLKNVAAQQDQLELVATQLKSCCGFLQESLRTGSQIEILAMAKPLLQVQDVTSSFKPESLEPEERADLEFECCQKELLQMCQQFGQIIAKPICHEKCISEGNGLKLAVVGEKTTATVHVVDKEGKKYSRPLKISCELVSSDGSRHVGGEAKKMRDGRYEISYLPQHRGYHYLHIRVGGKHISGSPFPLSVITTTPTNIITGVNGPWGLALDKKGQLVVVEAYECCVSIFNGSGKKIRSFGSRGSRPGQLERPHGVALSATTGNILVANQMSRQIHIYTSSGMFLKTIGTEGNGPLHFNCPVDIAINPESKKIYIADAGSNNRVKILNEDQTFFNTFGASGSRNGQFRRLLGISLDSRGNAYVADTDNQRIQVFKPYGEYIRQFGKRGSGKGELGEPTGIAVDSNNIIYVSDLGNHRISIFTKEGHFLRSFGTQGMEPGQFHCPSRIMISKNGVIYVSDRENKRVQIF